MSLNVTITNTSDSRIKLEDLYMYLGPSGADNDAVTVQRTMSQLDRMEALKTLVNAGTVTVDIVPSSDNFPGPSIPQVQSGVAAGLDVSDTQVITQAVSFPIAYDSTVTPNVSLTVVQGSTTTFKARTYVRSLTHTGFTIALDVTTPATGTTVSNEAETWSPATNGTLLGPFTATVAHHPVDGADVVTLNWTESTVAKTATITDGSVVSGTNAANVASASVIYATGVIVVTFAAGHAPDASSLTVSYTILDVTSVCWESMG